MELVRRNGHTSDEDSEIDCYEHSNGKPVQVDAGKKNSRLKPATRLPTMGIDLKVPPNGVGEDEMNNKKRRSRTSILSVIMAEKNWSNKQQYTFAHQPNLTKIIKMETLSIEFKAISLEINQLENRHTEQ